MTIESIYLVLVGIITPTLLKYIESLVQFLIEYVKDFIIGYKRKKYFYEIKNDSEGHYVYQSNNITTYLQNHADVSNLSLKFLNGSKYYPMVEYDNLLITCSVSANGKVYFIHLIIYGDSVEKIKEFYNKCQKYSSQMSLHAKGDSHLIFHNNGATDAIPLSIKLPKSATIPDNVKNELDRYMSGDIDKFALLLHGPPGTGKTTLIKSILKYLDCSYISLNDCKFKNGQAFKGFIYNPENHTTLGSFAKGLYKRAFVGEEIDILWTLSREDKKPEILCEHPTLEDWLMVLDGVNSIRGVFMFTTNKLETIDEAFYRPGRMDMLLHLTEPKCSYIN